MFDDIKDQVKIEHEDKLLWCIATAPECAYRATETLRDSDFLGKETKTIFIIVQNLANNAQDISFDAISREILNKNTKEYLDKLKEQQINIGEFENYIDFIKDQSSLRRIENLCSRVASETRHKNRSSEIINELMQGIIDIQSSVSTDLFKNPQEVYENTLQQILNREGGNVEGYKTGLKKLDDIIGSLKPGKLYTVAARSSHGKTALVSQIASTIALNYSVSVAFFSIEMAAEELMERIISQTTDIPYWKITKGLFTASDIEKIKEYSDKLSNIKLLINDSSSLRFEDIISKCKILKIKEGCIGPIIIDYLQLMNVKQYQGETRDRALGRVSGYFKSLAKDLKTPVILVSQIRRSVDEREDKRPLLSDLRETGSIENDSDVVVFVYREHFYTRQEELENSSEIIVAKHRGGKLGTAFLNVDLDKQKFYD